MSLAIHFAKVPRRFCPSRANACARARARTRVGEERVFRLLSERRYRKLCGSYSRHNGSPDVARTTSSLTDDTCSQDDDAFHRSHVFATARRTTDCRCIPARLDRARSQRSFGRSRRVASLAIRSIRGAIVRSRDHEVACQRSCRHARCSQGDSPQPTVAPRPPPS